MHTTDEQAHGKERFGAYAKTALIILGLGVGVVTLAAFPGLAVVVREFTRHRRRSYSHPVMRQTLYRLKKRGFVRVVDRGDELRLQLTPDGKKALKKIKLQNIEIPKPEKWDGVWRLVAFDIPEQKRKTRFYFRKKLMEMGFVKLEKSLFVHPYPCDTEVGFLIHVFGIGPYVHRIVATSFNGDRRWEKHFGLSTRCEAA